MIVVHNIANYLLDLLARLKNRQNIVFLHEHEVKEIIPNGVNVFDQQNKEKCFLKVDSVVLARD